MARFKTFCTRVDVQVSILTASMVLLASLFISYFSYTSSYNETIHTMSRRASDIFDLVNQYVDTDIFYDINTKNDINSSLYTNTKNTLKAMQNMFDIMNIYATKENESGDFIYIIDGHSKNENFSYPGDLVKGKIAEKMSLILNGDENTSNKIDEIISGDIFIFNFPYYNRLGEIVGVVGIEFDAQYENGILKQLIRAGILISFSLSVLSILIAYFVFRRISNPSFKDMSTIDKLTSLKNRNAFELNINNTNAKRNLNNIGIVVIDLNKLKYVNDTLGHSYGDDYIKLVATVLKNTANNNSIGYRIGGDEFVVISNNTSDNIMINYINNIKNQVKNQKTFSKFITSISCGYAIYNSEIDKDLDATFKRADKNMYDDKTLSRKITD